MFDRRELRLLRGVSYQALFPGGGEGPMCYALKVFPQELDSLISQLTLARERWSTQGSETNELEVEPAQIDFLE